MARGEQQSLKAQIGERCLARGRVRYWVGGECHGLIVCVSVTAAEELNEDQAC